MPLDIESGARLGRALGVAALPVASALCGREQDAYLKDLQGADQIVVACTQERTLFNELAQNASKPVRFVNIREFANWGQESDAALAKTAALLALAALPAADPVPTVSYHSGGKTLLIGSAAQVLPWAEQLKNQLDICVLLTGDGDAAPTVRMAPDAWPEQRQYRIHSGTAVNIRGWLGAFKVRWEQANPIDLQVCVGCNACVDACPENAISSLYQIDAAKCTRHGDCVTACGAVGAIDFSRANTQREEQFDLILDLSAHALIALHQPPFGYFFPGPVESDRFAAILKLTQMVGDFEKPKYFSYKEKLCGHGRNQQVGCTACIDVCSAQAISSAGDRIKVNANLCAGCGACSTVCPSGALSYAYHSAPYTGGRLKTLLTTYARAQGVEPVILLHSEKAGRALIAQLGRLASQSSRHYSGLPARVMPLEVQHTASVGIDVWLAAFAYGASGVTVLVTDEEAPQYITSLREQMAVAQTILSGLGYAGEHVQLICATTPKELDSALQHAPRGAVVQQPATFNVAADKRNTLDFALAHLHQHALLKPQHIALPAGAPFGALKIDTAACTLCMSCVGACPTSALMDSPNMPQLRFIEKNCIQCGLCEVTCPENAITLIPQISFSETWSKAVVLNEAEPFCCIKCSKPFGTLQMIQNMLTKLSSHSAFSGNLDRIKMCGDCRVVDMMQDKKEVGIGK